ncbi:MAG: GNAT family N-acetyltransferase [Chitinophagales bacterium]
MKSFTIRPAQPQDAALLLSLIKELAVYEKLESELAATSEQLREALFNSTPTAYAVIAEENGTPIGFALYFYNFSTFIGKKGLYLEDLFLKPAYRGKGFGKALFLHLAAIAKNENCGRMEWSVLDWNQPAIDFYKSLGATAMNEWTVYRLNKGGLQKLGEPN